MANDLWQQWQAFAAALSPANLAAQAKSGRDGGFGFAPFVDAAEQFAAAARTYIDGAARAQAPAAAAGAFGDLLREQFADFQMPWSGGFKAGSGASPASAFDFPAFGATREHQQRMQRVADAWRRMDDAQRRLQRLWSDALRDAATAFTARLVPPPAEPSAEALQKLYDTWIDCAEDAYGRAAHTEVFCNALAEFVNAGSEWRRELQAGFEHASKLLDLPTRSEINALMQRLRSVEERLPAAHDAHEPQAPARKQRKPPAAARRARRARGKAKP